MKQIVQLFPNLRTILARPTRMLEVRQPGHSEQDESRSPFAHGVGRDVEGNSDLLVGESLGGGQHEACAEGHCLWGGGSSLEAFEFGPGWGIERNRQGDPGHGEQDSRYSYE
jgi:hypothetical protein